MTKQLLLVGLGGGAGSILRYISVLCIQKYASTLFPLAVFTVNIAGCLLFGLFAGFAGKYGIVGNDMKMLLLTGFCGGYTTFSTFSAENLALLHDGRYAVAALYIAASVVTGILAVIAGHYLSKL
jgi:CrcB protein